MPRESSILGHPQVDQINALILAKRPLTEIQKQFLPPGHAAYENLRHYAAKFRPTEPGKPISLTPTETFLHAFGFPAMPHQVSYLDESRPTVVLKGRQVGMTHAGSALAVHTARSMPGSTSVIISPSLRQSSEVTARARLALWEWDEKLKQDSSSLLRTAAGSRIISLPGSARGIRGYACDLVILDEAAWISDETWAAARPLVSATGGRLIAQSTPGLPSGWFYELVTHPPEGWAFIKVRSDEVPTISPDFLASEKRTMSPELYAQEYEAEFGRSGGALFSAERIASMILPQ